MGVREYDLARFRVDTAGPVDQPDHRPAQGLDPNQGRVFCLRFKQGCRKFSGGCLLSKLPKKYHQLDDRSNRDE